MALTLHFFTPMLLILLNYGRKSNFNGTAVKYLKCFGSYKGKWYRPWRYHLMVHRSSSTCRYQGLVKVKNVMAYLFTTEKGLVKFR